MKIFTNLRFSKNLFLIFSFIILNFNVYSSNRITVLEKTIISNKNIPNLDLKEISDIVWPTNWDGLPENNPMLECSSGFELDTLGNPHPNKTGYPTGLTNSCGTDLVAYTDQTYPLSCGIKILREWTIENSCTGEVEKNTQIIRISDNTIPTFDVPNDFTVKSSSYVCSATVTIPEIIHLKDNCDANPKWWVTSQSITFNGDNNNNGYVDLNETWKINTLDLGEYSICYHVIDNCGNEDVKCVNITVIDDVPPIPVCQQYVQVGLTALGTANVYVGSFDSGSFDNCNPIYFKLLRVNDSLNYDGGCLNLNEDDDLSTPEIDVWYDNNVSFCLEDIGKSIMVNLRVFDKNPGNDSVDPTRMEYGGDLYRNYNDCWSVVTVEEKLGQNDNIISVCHKFKKTNINETGTRSILASSFNNNSRALNGNSLYIKAIRVNDSLNIDMGCSTKNGDDDISTDNNDIWFDDEVFFCCEDVNKETLISVRVFDKNPGNEPIKPERMIQGGDLFNHYNDCSTRVFVKNLFPPLISCEDITLYCTNTISPEENPSLKPNIKRVCDYTLNYTDSIIDNTKIFRTWEIQTINNGLSNFCTQTINLVDTTSSFDPCTIIFPEDVKTDCSNELALGGKPIWEEDNCDVITAQVIREDTFKYVDSAYFKIIREWSVVDWSSYESNTNVENNIDAIKNNKLDCDNLVEDGYYRYTQVIILTDSISRFDPCTIEFPSDESVTCYSGIIEEPTWIGNYCNTVTTKIISEDTFTFVDDACIKIIRNWAVIDWSVYENDFNGGDTNIDAIVGNKLDCDNLVADGYYKYTQIIKVIDKITPNIYSDDMCIGTADCYAYNTELSASASDSCNVLNYFNWKYIIVNLNTFDTIQYSFNYTPEPTQGIKGEKIKDNLVRTSKGELLVLDPLPMGEYKVIWKVGDGCGNASSTTQFFEVVDKKSPTPILVDIATVVMQNGKVELRAITFDKGDCGLGCLASVDNCTPKSGLLFTFSDKIPHLWEDSLKWSKQYVKYKQYFFDPNTGNISTESKYLKGKADAWLPESRTSKRVFICDSMNGTQNLPIYVFDKFDDSTDKCDNNNFDYANVELFFKNCENGYFNISGTVNTPFGLSFDDINMRDLLYIESQSTKPVNGYYHFNVGLGNHKISGNSDEDYLKGITTGDIITIGQHLLGIKNLDSPLKHIAADVNYDGKITAIDILNLRKLILKENDKFRSHSWIAISRDYTEEVEVKINGSTDYADINFTAIKIGDVNFSSHRGIPDRIDRGLSFIVENTPLTQGETIEIPFYAKNFSNIHGVQFSMNIFGLNIEEITPKSIGNFDYNVLGSDMLFSWSNFVYNTIDDDELLFVLKVTPNISGKISDILSLNDYDLRSEAYYGDLIEEDVVSLEFREPNQTKEVSSKFRLLQNTPNPFSNKTTIGFELPNSSKYKLSIFDSRGSLIYSKDGFGEKGINKINMNNKVLSEGSGVYLYRIETDMFVETKKMIKL